MKQALGCSCHHHHQHTTPARCSGAVAGGGSSSRPTRKRPAHRLLLRAAAPAHASTSSSHTIYIHRSVRADEHVEVPGNLVVHGDVSDASSIEAAGNVMVWGRLSGHVHAGCTGDQSATISALELRGAQLVIAHSTSLGAARITVPGPHTASVQPVGRGFSMNLTPLGPAHPALNPVGLTSSVKRWLDWYPAAAAALLTGCYALLAGLALLLAPKTVLGLLFDASAVPSVWIRVGGVLFATFGGQYLGTAVADYRQVRAASRSSSGCPDMPFRPASPHLAASSSTPAAPGHTRAAPAAVAATYQPQHTVTAAAGQGGGAGAGLSGIATASAMLHDSSSAFMSVDAAAATADVATSSSSSPPGGGSGVGGGRSVPASQLTREQIEALRQEHKQQHKAAQQQQSSSGQLTQHAAPPTWAYASTGFYEASVWSRLGLAATFALLVVVCGGPPGLLVLAVVNMFGALSMLMALQKQWRTHVMGDLPT